MKALVGQKSDFQVIQGTPGHVKKQLDTMAAKYKVKVHTANINAQGDLVVIAERMVRENA